jgi:hypothetical protein
MLDEARARAKLPILDNIRIAAPCSADWAKMTGDDRARFCGDCKLNVYNLSDMTRDEAETLIREREGRLCVRYYQRADGTILLKDCTVGVRRRRRRRIAAAGVAAALAGVGGGAAFALRLRGGSEVVGDTAPAHEHELMGRVAVTPAVDPAGEGSAVTAHQGMPAISEEQIMEMKGQMVESPPPPVTPKKAAKKARR